MTEIYFPDGVWEIIRSYMPIWKYPYRQVMLELPICTKKRYSIYTSAKIQPRFIKVVYYHPFLHKVILNRTHFFEPYQRQAHIITYEIYTENNNINNNINNNYG